MLMSKMSVEDEEAVQDELAELQAQALPVSIIFTHFPSC